MALIPHRQPKRTNADEFTQLLRGFKCTFAVVPDLHGHFTATHKAIQILSGLEL